MIKSPFMTPESTYDNNVIIIYLNQLSTLFLLDVCQGLIIIRVSLSFFAFYNNNYRTYQVTPSIGLTTRLGLPNKMNVRC